MKKILRHFCKKDSKPTQQCGEMTKPGTRVEPRNIVISSLALYHRCLFMKQNQEIDILNLEGYHSATATDPLTRKKEKHIDTNGKEPLLWFLST